MGSDGATRGKPLTEQQFRRFQQAIRDQAAGRLTTARAVYRSLLSENVRIPHLFHRLAQIEAQISD